MVPMFRIGERNLFGMSSDEIDTLIAIDYSSD